MTYGDNPTKHQKAILKSALATNGKVRFERWTHRKTKIEVEDGVTVVTTYYDMGYDFRSHGWVNDGETELTEAGIERARRVR